MPIFTVLANFGKMKNCIPAFRNKNLIKFCTHLPSKFTNMLLADNKNTHVLIFPFTLSHQLESPLRSPTHPLNEPSCLKKKTLVLTMISSDKKFENDKIRAWLWKPRNDMHIYL